MILRVFLEIELIPAKSSVNYLFYNKFAKELDKHRSCYEFSHAKDTLLFNELGHIKETEVFIYLNFTDIYSFFNIKVL